MKWIVKDRLLENTGKEVFRPSGEHGGLEPGNTWNKNWKKMEKKPSNKLFEIFVW